MKILASDFDATLYFTDDYDINKNNIEAVRMFMAQGNTFIIITGRNYSDLKKILVKENIPYSYLICEDGAKIFNSVDYCLDTIGLSRYEVEKIVAIIEKNKWKYYLSDGYNNTNNYDDCVKIVIECSDEKKQKEIVDTINSQIPIHVYASKFHVNIIHSSVNKEKALKRLFNLENLDYSNLRVIGDNDNDYEMLKSFDGGVIKIHHEKLDSLEKKEYEKLSDYIEELMKN